MAQGQFRDLIKQISGLKEKRTKDVVIYITNYAVTDKELLFNGIKESITHFIAFVEVLKKETFIDLLKELNKQSEQSRVDQVIVDVNIFNELCNIDQAQVAIPDIELFIYSDEKAWADSITSLMYELYREKKFESILLVGNSNLTYRVIKDIYDLGVKIACLNATTDIPGYQFDPKRFFSIDKNDLGKYKFDCILSTSLKEQVLDKSYGEFFQYKLCSIDGGIGAFSSGFIQHLHSHESEIIRIDNRASISSNLISILETSDLRQNVMGSFVYNGIRVVAGGQMGKNGDVIVDSISDPAHLIGIANGSGQVIYPPYDKKTNDKLKEIANIIKE